MNGYIDAKDGSSTFRFETPEALMKHAADCQTKGDGPGFMNCWTDQAFRDFVPSYLLTAIMQLQYAENAPHSKPRHPEEIMELKQILAEEFGGNEAGKSLLALALAHKEIADRSDDKFAEAAEATAESPLVQILATSSTNLIDARSFIMRLAALHKKYEEPDAKKEPRVLAYTVEQDGDKAVATETTGKNKFGLIKTEMGWRINDVFYGLKAKAESVTLQGEWEFISAESDGVTREYKILKTQSSMARLTITGDMWTVKAGNGTKGMGSGGQRVEIDGNRLTFHGMTTMMPGLGSNEEIPTIGYGLWQVDGDTLTYLMTPAVAESALNGQSEPPIQFPDSFETKGTENNVFRLRRIHPSTPPTSSSPTNSSTSKSSPEYPLVEIVVHDEEGKPLEGVKVSLFQLAKDQGGQVLEINETSNASGLVINRNLPYGHYELSAKTSDGWYLPSYGSRLNVEFEKGLSLTLVVPAPAPFGRLTVRDDANLRLAASAGLRFGILKEVNGPGFWVSPAPEPESDLGAYDSFPTVTNGIEQVGVEIRFEIAKNIPQPSLSGTHLNSKWKWTPVDKGKSTCRYLIVNGQARAFVNESVSQDNPFHALPKEECELFKLPSAKHRVGGSLLALREPTAMPLEIEIPAGEISIYVERILGKPSLATMKALNWEPHEDQPELWLAADVQRNSAWIERLFDTSAWIRTNLKPGYNDIAGHLQIRRLIRASEALEVSLAPKPIDQKTSSASAARTMDNITSVYNEQTRQLRTELFTPPIPDLTAAQMREAMLDAAEQYRKQGRVEVSSALKISAETNRLSDRLTFMGMCGTMSDGFRQITPQFNFEAASNSALMVVLGKAELRYSRNGWSSKTWGDIHPPIAGTWELVSVEQRGETLTQAAYDQWRKAHESWAELTIGTTSLTMIGDNAAKLDFSVDYEAGLLPQYTIRQDGNTKYSGVLMGNGFIDDNELVVAVDLEGSSTPQTFHTTDGKSTKLTYRRRPKSDILTIFQSHPKATDRVKRAFESAAKVARKDDTTFNTLHLLAALMRDGSLPEIAEVAEGKLISMTDLINRCDDAARVAERLFKATGDRGTGASQTTSAEQWKELFEAAELKAKEWKHDYLGPAHLLMAFIADDPLTKLFLKEQGIEAAEIRDMAIQIYFSPGRDAPVVRPIPESPASHPETKPREPDQSVNISKPKRLQIREAAVVEASADSSQQSVDTSIVEFSGMRLQLDPTRPAVLTEDDIMTVEAVTDPNNTKTSQIVLTLTPEAGARFLIETTRLSSQPTPGYLVVDFDGRVLSALRVNDKISNKVAISFSERDKLDFESVASAIRESIAAREKVAKKAPDARSVVEAYVASALTGDVAKAASLAKNSPADPKRIQDLPEFLNVQRLKIETVYINDPAKPTQALATSVAVRLEEEHKDPDGRRDGFMVFTLEFTDDKWLVIDIDFETESGAEKELNKFLKANPNSIGIPPQSQSLSR